METKKIIVLHDCERVSFRGEWQRIEEIEGSVANLRRCIYVYNQSRYDLRFVAGDFRAGWIEPKLMGVDRMEWGFIPA